MLYCPKCQATYEDGVQRFCTNEGVRLLPLASSEKTVDQPLGVFSSILGKSLTDPSSEKSGSAESETQSAESSSSKKVQAFQPPGQSRFFKQTDQIVLDPDEKETEQEAVEEPEETEEQPFELRPLGQIIDPRKIPEKQELSVADDLLAEDPDILEPEAPQLAESADPEIKEPVVETELPPEESFELFSSPADAPDMDLSGLEDLELETPAETRAEPVAEIDDAEPEIFFDSIPEIEIEDDKSEFSPEDEEISRSSFEDPIELDFDEPLSPPPVEAAENVPDFELEIGGIEEIPDSTEEASPIDLDLDETARPVMAADEMPQIELELEGIDEISDSAPFEELPEKSAEPDEISRKDEDTGETESPAGHKTEPKLVKIPAELDIIKPAPDQGTEIRPESEAANRDTNWYLPVIIGLVILGLGAVGLMFLMNPKKTVETPPANSPVNRIQPNTSVLESNNNGALPNAELPVDPQSEGNSEPGVEYPSGKPGSGSPRINAGPASPPPPRVLKQPPNTVLYKNRKSDQKGELAKKFLGFSIFYPKDWKENRSAGKFLDIKKTTPDGFPIEQFLIEPYDSRGTFQDDQELFKELVEKSNNDLKGILTNYQVISEGETTIQNDRWRVYEVKFQGLVSSRKLILWGRRIWMPVQRKGMKSGFIITMIATSLANDVKSVDDIGVKGELATILNSFEPDMN